MSTIDCNQVNYRPNCNPDGCMIKKEDNKSCDSSNKQCRIKVREKSNAIQDSLNAKNTCDAINSYKKEMNRNVKNDALCGGMYKSGNYYYLRSNYEMNNLKEVLKDNKTNTVCTVTQPTASPTTPSPPTASPTTASPTTASPTMTPFTTDPSSLPLPSTLPTNVPIEEQRKLMLLYIKTFSTDYDTYKTNYKNYSDAVKELNKTENDINKTNAKNAKSDLQTAYTNIMKTINQIKQLTEYTSVELAQKNAKYLELKTKLKEANNLVKQGKARKKSLQDTLSSKEEMLEQTRKLKNKSTISLAIFILLNLIVGTAIIMVLTNRIG